MFLEQRIHLHPVFAGDELHRNSVGQSDNCSVGPVGRCSAATGKVMLKCERFAQWPVFPGGKMPPSTAGKMPAAPFSVSLHVAVDPIVGRTGSRDTRRET